MTRYEELREEMWEAYRENCRFIKAHNIKKVKDESPEIQQEMKRLEKIVCEKEQLCMNEARRIGIIRIIE